MSSLLLSQRANNTPASPIRRLSYLAEQAKRSGKHVFHLNIGQPDLTTPVQFLDGLRRYESDVVAYESSEGNPALRSAWTRSMNETLGLQLKSEQMLITMGASEALVFVFMTCCDPGDEIITFDPTYANYMGFAAIAGINLVPIVSLLDEGFALPSAEKIAEKITDKTKAILLCSPNNPTGTVYSRDELQMLLDLAIEHDLFLVVDETYRELVYDGLDPLSVFHLKSECPNVIVVDSLSKRYSLCGARIGCLITANEEVLAKTLNIAQARLSAPTVEQHAAAYMLASIDEQLVAQACAEYQRRRDVLFDGLMAIPGIDAHKPSGAFYTIARLPIDDAEKFARFLLSDFSVDNQTVFLAPAAGFYMDNGRGKNKIRLAYVLNSEDIRSALAIVESGLKAFTG